MQHYIVTADNIDMVKTTMAACDQEGQLIPGCETWGIIYQPGNQRGQMTRWPNGRGAVDFGGDSAWGDWKGELLLLDERDENEQDVYYDEDGDRVNEDGTPYIAEEETKP